MSMFNHFAVVKGVCGVFGVYGVNTHGYWLIPSNQWLNDYGEFDPKCVCEQWFGDDEILETDTNLSYLKSKYMRII